MKQLILLFSITLLVFSCGREDIDTTTPDTDPPIIAPPTMSVNASVIGSVIDLNGEPVEGATVTLYGKSTFTDELGIFNFKDATLYEDGTFIQVVKSGFMDGSRKFYASEGNTSNIKIQLIDKVLRDEYDAQVGAQVTFDGAEIDLPQGTYTTKDGQSYNGSIQVYSHFLDPTQLNTQLQMPGDLTGVDAEGDLKVLMSFGMIGVDLETTNGELLDLPAGTTATISLPLDPALLANAPSTIPLWHFDDTNGSWVEEGTATLVNGQYIGEVSHFSFWNCDVPRDYIDLSGRLVLNRLPWENALVKVTELSSGTFATAYTNANGVFSGKVPGNENLRLELFDPCGEVVFSLDIAASTTSIDLGNIEVILPLGFVTLTGKVSSCAGEDSDFRYIVVDFGSSQISLATEADGTFEHSLPACDNANITVYGVDITNDYITEGFEFEFTGDVEIGTLLACEDLFTPGFYFDYEGINWDLLPTPDTNGLVGWSYEVTIFNDNSGNVLYKEYDITIIDWTIFDPNINNFVFNGIFTVTPGENTAPFEANFASQGFKVEDSCTVEVINQAGEEYLRFKKNSTGSTISITDAALYPGNVTEVKMDMSFSE